MSSKTQNLQARVVLWLQAVLPVLIWAGIIFWLSHQPQLPSAANFWSDLIIKKGAHVTVYGILYFLVWRAQRRLTGKMAWALPWLLTLGYAISDEWHQSLVPGRMPHPRDVGLDMLGASLALAGLWYRFGTQKMPAPRTK